MAAYGIPAALLLSYSSFLGLSRMPEARPVLPSPTGELVAGTVVGRFCIQERLGQGGMGEVYRADDTKLKRTVALKRLAPQLRADSIYRRRFQEEAERASRFSDSHVAAVYDVLEEQGEIFLVLEYVEGETLRNRLRRPVSLEEFFTIAIQCAEALIAAHERGIVHCDIKPENIMLTKSGQVKILDFGVAKHLPRSDQSSTIDRAGTFAGTPAYMSPEVLLEHAPDGRADVFSLGVVFYETLTRQHPFLAGSFVATADRIRKETPTPIRIFNSGVPDGLEALVSKAIAKDPAQRYASGEELVKDLALVQAGLTPTTLQQVWPPARLGVKEKWIAAISVFLVAALLVLLPFYWSQLKWWLGFGRPVPMHLAILPFRSTAEDPANKAFCDGMTETLAAKLAHLTGAYPVQIVPTSEIRGEGVTTVQQARKGFGVNLVLEGSLQESGNRVRITYGLVDAKTMRQLAADTVTADAEDVFNVQDTVVENVVSMLGLQLQSEERLSLVAHGTQEPAAYDFYLRGLGYLQDYDKPENLTNAITLFNRALDRDPKYALAYSGLGEAYWSKYESTRDPEWVRKAEQACERAVSLDPNSASGHACLGTVFTGTGKYEMAVEQFHRAADLDPTSDGAIRGLALAYERLGKMSQAEQTFLRAIQMRPQYWAGYDWLGGLYSDQARYSDAAREFSRAIELAPDDPHGYRKLGGVYIFMGQYPKAIETLRKAISLTPSSEAYSNLGIAYFNLRNFDGAVAAYEHACNPQSRDYIACGNLARAYYWAPNRRGQAADVYRRAIRLAEERLQINPRDGDPHILTGTYYAMLGDKPHAIEHLRRALELRPDLPEYLLDAALIHNQFGEHAESLNWLSRAVREGYSPAEIRASPEFDNLAQEARFKKLVSLK
jgi:eukaryotic-like serine/threonine-protein kinase